MAAQKIQPWVFVRDGKAGYLKMSEVQHTSIVTAPQAAPTATVMHPLVQAAVAAGSLDPAAMQQLLSLQQQWDAMETKRSFTRALVAMKKHMPMIIGKDAKVDFTNSSGVRTFYRHTSLDAAIKIVTPFLLDYGFALTWKTESHGSTVTVTCRLVHVDGYCEESSLSAPPDTKGAKSGAQGVASTVTLLERYTALALLGIVTADMKDPDDDHGNDPTGGADDEGSGEQAPGNGRAKAPPRVNVKRNLNAVVALAKYGKTREDAEAFLGCSVSDWTSEHLERLRKWLGPEPAEPGASG